MIRRSAEINELAAALALAQGEIEAAPKDSVNPHFKSRYADFAACWGAARGPLSKHGLAVFQDPQTNFEAVTLTVVTTLMHKSGQWAENDAACRLISLKAQDIGAATTFMKRYGFCAAVGIVADEDDDGNKASGRGDDKGRLQEKKDQRHGDAEAARAAREAVTQRAPTPVAGIFEGTPEQEKIVARILEKKGVPTEFWDEIRKRLLGKRSTEIENVIEAVRMASVDAQGFQSEVDKVF